jgi:hypothetical protein
MMGAYLKEYNKKYYNDRKEYHAKQNRRNHLRRKYGITPEEYEEMVRQQNNLCAICGKPEERIDIRVNKVVLLSVDHSHKTGKVRGLLCHSCNYAVGMFKDNEEALLKAADYIRRG